MYRGLRSLNHGAFLPTIRAPATFAEKKGKKKKIRVGLIKITRGHIVQLSAYMYADQTHFSVFVTVLEEFYSPQKAENYRKHQTIVLVSGVIPRQELSDFTETRSI